MQGVLVEPARMVIVFHRGGKLRELVVPLTGNEMRALGQSLLEAAQYVRDPGPPAHVVDLSRAAAPLTAEG